jgi:hypothetical protein
MNRNRLHFATATAFVAILAIAGCKKEEPAAAAPPPVAAAKAPATVSVVGLDLGTSVGANMKLDAAKTTFGPMDTIIAAVATATSDPAASVSAKLGVKWTGTDGKVFNDEGKDAKFTGSSVTDFRVANPAGYPAGKYKIEVLLNDKVVQSKDFEVK